MPVAAQQDALTAARYRAFILPRLMGSLAALASLPVYLVLRGVPTEIEIIIFSWLVTPILVVYFLIRTGRYEIAHILSSLSLSALVMLVAFLAGGNVASFAAIWLVIVPLEAALSGSRRVVLVSTALSLAAGLLLMMPGVAGLVRPSSMDMHAALAALATTSALLYATGLALGAVSLIRTASQLLGAREDRCRLLADNMTDVIILCGKGSSVIFASPAVESLLGVSNSELAGKELFERVHVADRPAFLAVLADAARGVDLRPLEFRIQRDVGAGRPGQFVWVEMSCRPFEPVSAGHQAASRDVVVVLRDISERKTQDDALAAARLESERVIADRGRFAATIGHELRTPLNAIIGFSDMLALGLTGELPAHRLDHVQQLEYARIINQSGQHLLDIVNDLLDLAKIDAGKFVVEAGETDPYQLANLCAEFVGEAAQAAGLRLAIECEPALPPVIADERRLKQVLLNLLTNSIKFTGPGGSVVLAVRRAEDGGISFEVRDTGIGMTPEEISIALQPFGQLDSGLNRRHEGTGLGLPLARSLVELNGGTLEIRSEKGRGTTVTVRLAAGRSGGTSAAAPPIVTKAAAA